MRDFLSVKMTLGLGDLWLFSFPLSVIIPSVVVFILLLYRLLVPVAARYKGRFTHNMPRPCLYPPMPCVNSHMPCRAPALLRQCRFLRESPHGSRKYPKWVTDRLFCSMLLPLFSSSMIDGVWFNTGHLHLRLVCIWKQLRGTPRDSRKKPNASS